jgi:hypothetical protein
VSSVLHGRLDRREPVISARCRPLGPRIGLRTAALGCAPFRVGYAARPVVGAFRSLVPPAGCSSAPCGLRWTIEGPGSHRHNLLRRP